ncbi:MAG: hypothetical protein KJO26_07500 [Deltaproteobacteria bacterium]|nr:hypothetical protein [Deltaproteobacteria bacterium]
MQDSVGGDNNRTTVIFQVADTYRFVGGMSGFENLYFRVITKIYRTSRPTFLRDDITMLDAK